jgi:hypothetical protein
MKTATTAATKRRKSIKRRAKIERESGARMRRTKTGKKIAMVIVSKRGTRQMMTMARLRTALGNVIVIVTEIETEIESGGGTTAGIATLDGAMTAGIEIGTEIGDAVGTGAEKETLVDIETTAVTATDAGETIAETGIETGTGIGGDGVEIGPPKQNVIGKGGGSKSKIKRKSGAGIVMEKRKTLTWSERTRASLSELP